LFDATWNEVQAWGLEVQAWSPWLMGDIKLLESVQRRAVNMVVGLQGLTYTETTDYRD